MMARYVPVIAVVPQHVATQLQRWAAEAPEIAELEQTEGLAELLERTGWTVEMLIAGTCLAEGLAASTARPFG